MDATPTLAFAASSSRTVLSATEELRHALEEPGTAADQAIRRLESAARRSINGLDDLAARGFDAPGGSGAAESVNLTVEENLAVALSQLNVATALGAAEQAVRRSEQAAPDAVDPLDSAIDELRIGSVALSAPLRSDGRQAFEPAAAIAADRSASLQACEAQVRSTLDVLSEKTAGVAVKAFTSCKGLAPQQIQQAMTSLGQRISLSEHARGFVRLAVRAVDQALEALSRLIPNAALAAARDRVHRLWVKLEQGALGPTLMATVLDADGARAHAEVVLAGTAADVDQLGRVTDALRALADRFTGHAALASTVIGAVVGVTAVFGVLHLAIPHLSLISAGAIVVVLATMVLLGMDFADTGGGLQRVRGVRSLLSDLAS